MPETTDAILSLLRYAAAPSIVGALASILFDFLRSHLPQDAESPSPLRRLGARLRSLLFVPRYARWAALLLAGLIGGLLNMAIAALSGGDVLAVADNALAGLMAMVASQLVHSRSLSAAVPDAAAVQSRLDALKDQ